jgi:hypothetical protein
MSGALELLLPLALVVLLTSVLLPALAQPKCSLTDAQVTDINFGENDTVKSACGAWHACLVLFTTPPHLRLLSQLLLCCLPSELRPPSGSVSCGDCTCALSTTFLSQLGKVSLAASTAGWQVSGLSRGNSP